METNKKMKTSPTIKMTWGKKDDPIKKDDPKIQLNPKDEDILNKLVRQRSY